MALTSYILPVLTSGLLMTVTFLLGRFGYSMMWIVLLAALNFIKSKVWKSRQKRILALQAVAKMEKEMVLAEMEHKLQDLPAWVQFPDTERVEWINKVVLQLWPHISEFAIRFVKEQIEPQVKTNLPLAFRSFTFEEMDMGDIPIRVGGVKVYSENVGRDKIVMDLDVAYAGDCEFVVSVGGFKAGLNNLQFRGKLRCILKPLVPEPPLVGGVSAFFLDTPVIDFNLTGLGELVEIPGLFWAVKSVVNTQVANICVIPNDIVIPLIIGIDDVKLRFPEPDGVVRIHIIEARNLENKDLGILKKGKSDPYLRVSVGSQNYKSKTIDDNLNPFWNEFFEAVVNQASGQMIVFECYDDDPGSMDEFLGRATIDLSVVRQKGMIDGWLPLEGAKHGEVHVRLYWLNLSTSKCLKQHKWDFECLKTNQPLNSALLMAYVEGVKGLPGPKVDLEPNPYLKLSLGNNIQKTLPKPKTSNPVFQHKFLFFVSNPDSQHLKVAAMQDASDRVLGETEVPIRNLMKEDRMELYQHMFTLALGTHQSQLVMTVRLRYLAYAPCERVFYIGGGRSQEPSSKKTSTKTTAAAITTVVTDFDQNDDTGLRLRTSVVLKESKDGTAEDIGGGLKNNEEEVEHNLQTLQSSASYGGSSTLRTNGKRHKRKIDSALLCIGRLGQIKLGIAYSAQRNTLNVSAEEARNLISFNQENTADVYVKLSLLTDGSKEVPKKTLVKCSTLNPQWEEIFEFEMPEEGLVSARLQVIVKDASNYGFMSSKPILGQIVFALRDFNPEVPMNQWFDLGPAGYEGSGFNTFNDMMNLNLSQSEQISS